MRYHRCLEDAMNAKKTLLAVPSAVAALAFLAPSPALAITGYAGAPTAVAAQYPTSADSQSTPPTSAPSTSAPSLTQTPTTSPGTQDGATPSTEDVSNVTSNPSQPTQQVVADAGSPSSSLPFTGYAAIVAIAAGFALLLGGVAARRVTTHA
jgi:hypothetical protein